MQVMTLPAEILLVRKPAIPIAEHEKNGAAEAAEDVEYFLRGIAS